MLLWLSGLWLSVDLGPRLVAAQPGLHGTQDHARDDTHQDQIAKHLDDDQNTGCLGNGDDVTEPDRGEDGHREVQGVGAAQPLGERGRVALSGREVDGGENQNEEGSRQGQCFDGTYARVPIMLA